RCDDIVRDTLHLHFRSGEAGTLPPDQQANSIGHGPSFSCVPVLPSPTEACALFERRIVPAQPELGVIQVSVDQLHELLAIAIRRNRLDGSTLPQGVVALLG